MERRMKTLAIKSTYDAYPHLTPFEREKLLKEEIVIERFKNQIRANYGGNK